MNKLGPLLKKALIVICVILMLSTCISVSVKYYRDKVMNELIEMVDDDEAEIQSDVLNEISKILENSYKINSYKECYLSGIYNKTKGNYEDATTNFLDAIEYGDDDQKAVAYRKLGIMKCEIGEYDDAIDYLNNALEFDSENDNALLYLAESYLQKGDYETAISIIDKYTNSKDLTLAQYQAVFTMYINLGEYDNCVSKVDEAIKEYPDEETSLIGYRLQANLLANDLEEANKDATRYCELTSSDIDPEIVIASYYYALGMYEESLVIYVDHIVNNEEYDLLSQAIECAYEIDNYETMLELSNIAINYYQDDEVIDYYKWKGIALMQLGQYASAKSFFDLYLATYTTHYEVIYLRALCKFTLNDYQGACEDFDLTIENDTMVEDSYYNRALCYTQLNDLDKAQTDLEEVVKLNSGSETYASAVELLKLINTAQ